MRMGRNMVIAILMTKRMTIMKSTIRIIIIITITISPLPGATAAIELRVCYRLFNMFQVIRDSALL